MAIEFEDLEVEVSRCLCDKPEVRILESPFDRPRARFEPPYELAELNSRLERLDSLLLEQGKSEVAERKRIAEEIGQTLFGALFPGKVGATFGNCLAALDTAREGLNTGLRIRISFGEAGRYLPEVVGLPWELLCNPETLLFPGSEPQTPVVRYLDISKKIKPLATRPPIKVLAVLSSPTSKNLNPIDLPKHEKILRRAIRSQKWLKVHFLHSPTLNALREKLDRHRQEGKPFHVLHFLGHGEFQDDGEGVLYFEGPDKKSDLVTGRELARHLAGFDELRLAVLTTCVGAQMLRRQGQHPFTGAASALVARGFPAVVAMQFKISEAAASQFTSSFYEKLAAGRPVDEAITEGRLRIAAHNRNSFEWACPVLFLRTPDGRILDLQPEEEVPVKKISVFNIRDHGKEEAEVNDFEVDLERFFKDRTIKDPTSWNTDVMEELLSVFNGDLPQTVPYHLVFAAPISVAFAAGYLFEAKAGLKIVKFSQRGPHGTADWNFEGEVPADAAHWVEFKKAQGEIPENFPRDKQSSDIAVAVGVSRTAMPAVQRYLSEQEPKKKSVGHVINAAIDRPAGHDTVRNGAHAYQLSQTLCDHVHTHTSRNHSGTVHFFISGPNAFAFALGRLCRCFPRIQLYEYNFGERGSGSATYTPSITLSPRG